MSRKFFDIAIFDQPPDTQPAGEPSGAHVEQFLDAHLAMVESLKKLLGRVPREG